MSNPNPNSDLDVEAYEELKRESKKTGKSIEQILTERTGKTWVYYDPNKKRKIDPEVAKTLAENTLVIKPKTEEPNE